MGILAIYGLGMESLGHGVEKSLYLHTHLQYKNHPVF